MIKPLLVVLSLGFAGAVMAQDKTCVADANAQKLGGTARATFLSNCEKEAKAKCAAEAKAKNLKWIAKDEYEAKCLKAAVG